MRAFDRMRVSVVPKFYLDDFDLYDTRLLIGFIIDSVRDVVGHIFRNLGSIAVVSAIRRQVTFTTLHMTAIRTLRHVATRRAGSNNRDEHNQQVACEDGNGAKWRHQRNPEDT